ncbi:MAG: hypothetical protein KA401_03105 [Anaerolineae bacterium]|nr:hypothetical protein [Anaerolineae bacterium]
MNVLNQFSYPLIVTGVLFVVFLLLRRIASMRVIAISEVLMALVFVAGFFALRTGEGDVADIRDHEAIIGNGRPTMIEFFSNFCTACLVLRPTVDDIIANLGDDFNVLRVNIHSEEGQKMREAYNFSFTPEFVVLDGAGIEVWRDHAPPRLSALRALVPG